MTAAEPTEELTGEVVQVLQRLIRQACVNDGTPSSGHEIRGVEVIADVLGRALPYEVVEPAPGRGSLLARIPGTDPQAPSLALVGHLDVVPVESGWRHDPFGGEVIDGYVWGRGAIDMLGLTASFAVVTARLARAGWRGRGDLVLAAVADEEAGGTYGTRWLVANRPELIVTDYALTENAGIVIGEEAPAVTLTVGEKSGAGRRLVITGRPGHGSTPWRSGNAGIIAARILTRIAANPGPVHLTPYWRGYVEAAIADPGLRARLLAEETIDGALDELGPLAAYAHAVSHLTVSPNVVRAGSKRNVIPGQATIDLDIRAIPGQTEAAVDAYLAEVIADDADAVTVEGSGVGAPSVSPTDTALTRAIGAAVQAHYPGARTLPVIMPGGTDAKALRAAGADAYGFGLFSRRWDLATFRSLFHGTDERIDIDSLALTAQALETTIRGLHQR